MKTELELIDGELIGEIDGQYYLVQSNYDCDENLISVEVVYEISSN